MSLLEDAVVNAKSAAVAVGKKAGQIVDVSKLRISAAGLNKEISARLEELGRIVYQARKDESVSEEQTESCVAAIDELYEQLDAVNEQITVLKKRIKCKECGYENSQEAVFCNKCGAKLSED